jgi:endo-alpha-1,4-polygalactosaminidase (GH114 family)
LASEVDSQAYYASLAPVCQRQYDEFPESTLHVSSQEYLEQLAVAQEKGLVILTVDYALDPDNIAWVYAESRRHGFVPFVSSRQLDRFVPPYGGQ